MADRKPLGQILLETQLLNRARLDAALRLQRLRGQRLGSTLLEIGFVREDDLLRCLSMQLGVPSVNLREVPLPRQILRALPARTAERHHVFPVAVRRDSGRRSLILAMAEPTDLRILNELEFEAGMRIRPAVATESSIMRAIARYYRFRHGEGDRIAPPGPAPSVGGGEEGGAPARPPRPAPLVPGEAPAPESRRLALDLVLGLARRGLLDRSDLQRVFRDLA